MRLRRSELLLVDLQAKPVVGKELKGERVGMVGMICESMLK